MTDLRRNRPKRFLKCLKTYEQYARKSFRKKTGELDLPQNPSKPAIFRSFFKGKNRDFLRISTDFWFWIFSRFWIKKNSVKTSREEKNQKTNKHKIEKILFCPKNQCFCKKIKFSEDNLSIFFLAAGFDRIFFQSKSCKDPASNIG